MVQFLTGPTTETRKALYHIRPSVTGAKRNLAELLPPGRGDGALELHIFIAGAGCGAYCWIPLGPKEPFRRRFLSSRQRLTLLATYLKSDVCLQEDYTTISLTEEVLRLLSISCLYYDFPVHGG